MVFDDFEMDLLLKLYFFEFFVEVTGKLTQQKHSLLRVHFYLSQANVSMLKSMYESIINAFDYKFCKSKLIFNSRHRDLISSHSLYFKLFFE